MTTAVMVKSVMSAHERLQRMEATLARKLPPVPHGLESGSCNVVAYGPSLKDTWHLIDDAPIVSMSGSHDFLIERGKIPKYHVEQDPRAHKAVFTSNAHPDVHYLIGTCCAPELFANFGRQHRVSVWHVIEPDAQIKEWIGANDPCGVCMRVGETVGVRAFELAAFLGFKQFRFYGFDCSWVDEQRAGAHNGDIHVPLSVGIGDARSWTTSHELLLTARSFVNMCLQLAGTIDVRVYGDGFAGALLGRVAQAKLDLESGITPKTFPDLRMVA